MGRLVSSASALVPTIVFLGAVKILLTRLVGVARIPRPDQTSEFPPKERVEGEPERGWEARLNWSADTDGGDKANRLEPN